MAESATIKRKVSAPRVRVRPARRRGSPPNARMGLAWLAPDVSQPSCTAAWRKDGMGRGSPPKQRGAQWRWRSSLR